MAPRTPIERLRWHLANTQLDDVEADLIAGMIALADQMQSLKREDYATAATMSFVCTCARKPYPHTKSPDCLPVE
jgi:hypothetical protein